MTVAELIEKLKAMPQDARVQITAGDISGDLEDLTDVCDWYELDGTVALT